jgi:hypothetical protein
MAPQYVFGVRLADSSGSIEKFTLPGVPGLAVPLDVFTLSHGDPGNAAAVQLA